MEPEGLNVMGIGLVLTVVLVFLLGYLEYHRRVKGQTRLWKILGGFVMPPLLLLFMLFLMLRLRGFG